MQEGGFEYESIRLLTGVHREASIPSVGANSIVPDGQRRVFLPSLGVEREREIERSERQVKRKSLYYLKWNLVVRPTLLLRHLLSLASTPQPLSRSPFPSGPLPIPPLDPPFSRFPHAPHESRPRPPPLPPRSPSTPGAAPFLHTRRLALASPSVPTRRRHAAPTASVPARRSGRARGLRPQVRRPPALRPPSVRCASSSSVIQVFDHTSQGEMELPVADPGPVRAEGLLLQCPYCDSEAMHKLAQILLPGLAAVCVDNTTGDLFRKPSVVAVDLRKEMVDHITQRSETFIADALVEAEANQDPENDMPEDPYEIVSIFMDDFSSTKRNIIGHVSGWLWSDSREDKIDDFVQEMEMTRFWPLERREAIAEVLLKNVDLKTKFHCPEKSENEERLADHKAQCSFRPVTCPNEGCRAKVSVRCMHDHDSACLFKILPCEQNCEKRLMRRDMDRHCITVCPMRPMKCPFGCDSSFPEHNLEEHCSEFLQPHLLKVLQVIHKKGFTVDELKDRALLLEKSDDHGKLAKAQDARSLTNVLKDLEAKMKDDESS